MILHIVTLLISSVVSQQPPQPPQPPQRNCLPLQTSQACPQFAQYSVQADPTLFSNVQQFDTYVRNSHPNSSVFLNYVRTTYNCPNWDGSGLRYPMSFICGLIIDVSSARFNCNEGAPQRQLCRSTASLTVSSFTAIFQNQRFCPAQGARTLPSDYQTFATNRLTNDNPGQNCILGIDAEVTSCGFATLTEGRQYCSNPTNAQRDPCCAQLGRSAGNPPPVSNATNSTTPTTPVNSTTPESSLSNVTESITPTSTAEASNSSSSSGPSQVLLYSSIGGGIAVLVGVGAIIYFLARRNSSETSSSTKFKGAGGAGAAMGDDGIPVSETVKVLYEYTPNLFDEIQLHVGDTVLVKHKFDDGWAFGFNMTTKQEGSFPLACVTPYDGPGNGPSRDSLATSYQQRASSLYVPS